MKTNKIHSIHFRFSENLGKEIEEVMQLELEYGLDAKITKQSFITALIKEGCENRRKKYAKRQK